MTTGHTAVEPRAHLSGVGPVFSAARNYVYSLNGELAEAGIHAGTLSVAAFIARSEMAELAATVTTGSEPASAFPVVDADDLAQHYWDMYTKRDRVEQIHPEVRT